MNTVLNYKGSSPIIKSVLEFAFETEDLPFPFILIVDALNPKDKNFGVFYPELMCVRLGVSDKNVTVPVFTFNKRYCQYFYYEGGVFAGVPYDVIIIQRAWRKYFLKKIKVRNDPIAHGLAEYFGHPSRLSFEIN
jgi:hypothetical protein